MTNEVLADWGEFRLLNEIVLPRMNDNRLGRPLGDDCAYLKIPGCELSSLVVTTDAAPRPLSWQLGLESYQTWGWYAVLINASDLASAGAKPLGFCSSVEAPESFPVHQFDEFFAGMAEACKAFSLPNAGGNIRAAPRFGCHGTALGITEKANILTRRGCKPGDIVVSIGPCGKFITAFLHASHYGQEATPEHLMSSMVRPYPRLREMAVLNSEGLISASSDNSDGVLGSLWNIAERSLCGFELDFDGIDLPFETKEIAKVKNLNPLNLFLFWGDWQVIACVANDKRERFHEVATSNDIEYSILGKAVKGPPALFGIEQGKRKPMNVLRNENFKQLSFNSDVTNHVDSMLMSELFQGV